MEKNEAELGPKPNKENQQDKIAGPKKIDREPGVKGSDPSKTVNVLDLPTVQCKCDNITWHEVKVLKTLTIKEADQSTMKPKEIKHVIVDAIACTRCGSILSDGVPVIRLRKEGE